MRSVMSKRRLKKCAELCCLVLFLVMIVMYFTSDDCHQKFHIELLCKEFSLGNIAGGMCYELCVQKSIYLHSCSKGKHGQLIFTINDTAVVKMPNRYRPGVSSFHDVYLHPEEGISMEQFRAEVNEHLIQTLGDGDHKHTVDELMERADVNKDDKVSLAEAKTLWSLLQQNEFLVLHVFHKSFHVPLVPQFCGEAYLVSNLPEPRNRHLYSYRGLLGKLLSYGFQSWLYPGWTERAKIGVGLLEFTLDIYQHHTDGLFYLCDANETNIGFTRNHDFLMHDLSDVLPRKMLESRLAGVECVSDDHCKYTEHCKTICDTTKGRCTGNLVRPNLSLVCDILKPYLLPDMPKVIRADFLNLMLRCVKLQSLASDFEVQHSLIVNDLRSLLWRHIRSEV